MRLITRRGIVAAGAGILAVVAGPRKSRAEDLQDMSAMALSDPPKAPPEAEFTSADGVTHTLAEFAGHAMVINLWATWCTPCVAEMPSLDALSALLAPHDIAVMPLSSDRGGAPVVQKFYQAHGIAHLPVLLDGHGMLARSWGVRGLPTTVVIDKQGRERGRLEGAADWAKGAETIRKLVAAG